MNYRYYSLPRYERSSSLERVNYNSSVGSRANSISRNLLDNYRHTRSKSEKADSIVLNGFTRALSLSPGQYSSREHVPAHHFITRRKNRDHSSLVKEEPLPTSFLKAHTPNKYDYVFLDRDRSLSNIDLSGDTTYSNYYPRSSYHSWYPRPAYFYGHSYPTYREQYPLPRVYESRYFNNYRALPEYNYYGNNLLADRRRRLELSRVPESSSYYTYRVLPLHNYNANDMIREHRRRLDNRNLYHYEFPEPPAGTFSGMRHSLNNVLGKIDRHKLLLDRYAGIDLNPNSSNVSNNIMEKSIQMTSYRHRY